jgi:5'-3' exonuclease
MHIPIIEVNGYADDLIGTQAKETEKKTTKSLWSPDKDFAQLVSEKHFMYKLPVWVMVSKYGEF